MELVKKSVPANIRPDFSVFTEAELEELFELFEYNTPLYGMLQTGDEVPIEIIVCVIIGLCSLLIYLVLKKKKI